MGINWSGDNWREADITINVAMAQLVSGVMALAVGIVIGALLFDGGGVEPTESGYAVNLWTELIGIAVTVVIINAISQRRTDADRKKLLFAQLKNKEPVIALLAFEELKLRGWIVELDKDGWVGVQLPNANMRGLDLSNATLREADLSGADLLNANLSGASLVHANMAGAKLVNVDLSHAIVQQANLSGASLWNANLSQSILRDANLSKTNLVLANLSGVELRGANLRGATHLNTTFDADTTLPDGNKWTPDTDIDHFTSGAWQPSDKSDYFGAYQNWKRNGWLTPSDDDA